MGDDADLHLTISGRVQGVGFRENLVVVARRMGATGWVRNRSDGTVETVIRASGTGRASLLQWVQRGPPSARVESVYRRNATAAESALVADRFRRLESC